jgi:two-component system response regulator AtoC
VASILLVVSDRPALTTLRRLLAAGGHETVSADSAATARRTVARGKIDAVIIDARVRDALALVPDLRKTLMRAPILVITGEDGMGDTLVAMRDGAFDCLSEPIDPRRLLGRLEDALRLTPAQAISIIDVPEGARAAALIGSSAAMREVFKRLGLLAASNATVLLRGESGTGKELAARVLHDFGPSGGRKPFVAVHCAALPGPLVEAEIFGHRKGAFTGADRDKPGKLEAAGEGTLFLDEVGEIPLDTQVKLLRVLQERQFERLGDTRPRPFRARILAATHRDLEELVRGGRFREDLYYRLNVATVTLPPLRDRPEDVPAIAERLLGEVTREVGRRLDGLSVAALEALCAAEWPGNVRELRNVLTRAVVRCRGRIVDVDDLDLSGQAPSPAASPAPKPGTGRMTAAGAAPPFPTLLEVEREHVRKALDLAKGHRGRACALLGVSRPTLLRKLRKFGLLEPGEQVQDDGTDEDDLERPVPTRRS